MKKRSKPKSPTMFSDFVADPPIATALLVFALIALVLAILEFSNVLAY